jgi:predicted membrane protein
VFKKALLCILALLIIAYQMYQLSRGFTEDLFVLLLLATGILVGWGCGSLVYWLLMHRRKQLWKQILSPLLSGLLAGVVISCIIVLVGGWMVSHWSHEGAGDIDPIIFSFLAMCVAVVSGLAFGARGLMK